jgi:hypothetical protein
MEQNRALTLNENQRMLDTYNKAEMYFGLFQEVVDLLCMLACFFLLQL